MYSVRRFLPARTRLIIVFTLTACVLVACSAWFINKYFWIEAETVKERLWPPPTFEQVEVKELRNIAGWFSLDCGYVRRFEEADRAIACAHEALRMKRRFYVAFNFIGFDSQSAYGLAEGRSGGVYDVATERGSVYNVPKAEVNRCETPPVEKTVSRDRFLTCWTAADDKAIGNEPKTAEIKNMRLTAWQLSNNRKQLVELRELSEAKPQRLTPSNKFDVECELVGGFDDGTGDYFVWTSVDFLVAPVTHAYEQMDDATLSSFVGWGQVSEMLDLKATPVYLLRPGESRNVSVTDLDLTPLMAAFPVGEGGELWPWLVRVSLHVQDRSGKQIASAERTLRLVPNSARKEDRYNDPLPSR